MIECLGLKKAFHQGQANEFWAVRGVNLQLNLGETTVLKGPSGSGKTTLLAMLGGLSRPTEGRIVLEGELFSSLPESFLAELRRERFGFVFQQFQLISGLTVLENIMLPAYPLGLDPAELEARAMALMTRFGLAQRARESVQRLSGGEQQRVAICRALINQPSILIADEPTANLDSTLSQELMSLFQSLVDDGMTLIISSHDPIVYEHEQVVRVVSMRDGLVVDA